MASSVKGAVGISFRNDVFRLRQIIQAVLAKLPGAANNRFTPNAAANAIYELNDYGMTVRFTAHDEVRQMYVFMDLRDSYSELARRAGLGVNTTFDLGDHGIARGLIPQILDQFKVANRCYEVTDADRIIDIPVGASAVLKCLEVPDQPDSWWGEQTVAVCQRYAGLSEDSFRTMLELYSWPVTRILDAIKHRGCQAAPAGK